MARQGSSEVRVYGPYPHRRQFRVVVREGSTATARLYATEEEAKAVIRQVKRAAKLNQSKPLDEAIDDYEVFLRNEKQNKSGSIDTTIIRLRSFFPDLELTVNAVDSKKAQSYYDSYRATPGARTKRLPSVDTHRNVLAQVKTFMGWCQKKKLTPTNPFDEVEGVGRRRHGKPQLRIDESRKWLTKAVELASSGDVGAIAAMITLLLGLRAFEIVSRVVRDVDDEGRLLWIPDSKTPAGRRTLEVPSLLQPFMLRLAEGRPANARLFGTRWRDWPRKEVARICVLARVMKVNAQSMRGLHSTLAVQAGVTGHVVAAALGHESFATTVQSYARPEAVASAKQQQVLKVLTGGRS
jgi:integrase